MGATLELELKLVGAPADIAALPKRRFLRPFAVGEGRWKRLASTYFDTIDGDLAREGLALRRRDESGRIRQNIKRVTAAGAVVREEFEADLSPAAAFPAPVGDDHIDPLLRDYAGALRPVAEIVVDRWTQPIRYGKSRLELAVDTGRAGEGAGAEAPVAEVELEFVDGDMADLFAFARLLADNAPLHLATRTKLEIAREAGCGAQYRLAKWRRPGIDREETAADTLQAMLAAIAVRIIDLQPLVLDIRAPAGIKQLRVALRRFRAMERTFRKAIADRRLYKLTRPARNVAKRLGAARDLDVFIDETMREVSARDPEGAAALVGLAAEKRAAAWADAFALVASREFVHLTIDLLEAGVLAPWRAALTNEGALPLEDFAPAALDKAVERSRRAEAVMDRRELAARHPLRIALKKQRYAAQILGPLYEKQRRKPYMGALSRLQESLGLVNDAVVACELAEEIASGGGDAAMRAAGFIAGYKTSEAQAAIEAIDHAWVEFEATPSFWHEE